MTDATPPPSPYPNAPMPSTPTGGDPLPPLRFDSSPDPVRDVAPSPTRGTTDSDASAKDKATDAAKAGKQAATEVAGTAADAAKDVAQETSAQAKDLVGKTRKQLSEQATVQQDSLVETLRDLANQLAGMADTDQDGTAVELVSKARDQTRQAADWLDQREPNEVVDGLRDLGRRRPGAFLLGSAVAGVLAGRLTRGVAAVHSDDAPAGTGAHRDTLS